MAVGREETEQHIGADEDEDEDVMTT